MTCAGSVPEAIIAFLDSTDYEDAVRNAISLGGDSDTQAAIAGGIAELFYGEVPPHIEQFVRRKLPKSYARVIDAFCEQYPTRSPSHQKPDSQHL